MDDVSRDAQLEKLMSELSWLRRLAGALVRDDSDADDLVQETWLVAAEHAPKDGRPLKPWLTRVALNVVRMRSRASKRRAARETAAESFAETSPTPDQLVTRVEAQRIVVDGVLGLAEPYRNTVLLHYFEDLSSAEIARRSGIPEGTVRRRLKVALDELRGRLRAEERKTGRCVIAALAPASVGRTALGVAVMKKIIAIVVVAVGLLFVASHLHQRTSSEPVVKRTEEKTRAIAIPREVSAAHVVVTVADEAGAVAGAMVRCAPNDGDVVVVKTGSDGNIAVDLAAGEWSIAASAAGHEPSVTSLAVVAGHDDRVRVVLERGGQTLTGTVTDASGGPIAGARIDAALLAMNAKANAAVAVAFTDAAGHYKLDAGSGEIVVAASHVEYAPQTRYVDLGPAGATADFALVPGGVIEGVVRDVVTKQPVAGAAVRATTNASVLELIGVSEHAVKADGAGKFRFAGLRPGAYELTAREGARSSRAATGVGLGVAEQQTDIVVFVAGTATIRGKVVDEAGAAVGGITVSAFGDVEGGNAISDGAGAFALEGLTPSRWALRGASDAYVSDGQAIVELKKTDLDGIVVRVRRGLAVKGHVEPRKSCDVELTALASDVPFMESESATTNASGEFEFRPLAPGKATVSARCADGEQGRIDVAIAPDAGERVVPVTAGGSIEGRVVDTSGKAVAGVMVVAEPITDVTRIEHGVVASGFKAVTSADGAFAIAGLGVGNYRLSALDRGRALRAKKGTRIALAAAQKAKGFDFVVERPTGTIRGTVTGADGAPIADAWVSVYQTLDDQIESLRSSESGVPDESRNIWLRDDGEGDVLPPVLTDARGYFEVTNLGLGKYQVLAEAESGKLRARAPDVTPDAQVAIHLATVSSLRGTVHGAHGATDLFSVRLLGPTEDARPFTDGAFVFPRLDPGDYTIDVASSDGTGKATAHVAPGDAASVDITLVANGTVTGRLVDKAGKPLTGMRVALIPDQPPGQLRMELREQPPTSGPDGRFKVDGPPGMRTLVILSRKPTAKRGISVQASNIVEIGDVTVDGQ